MKRALIASILGLATSVASSYGQANYAFDTYSSSLASPQGQVFWSSTSSLAPAGRAGSLATVADGFQADLLWAVGATTGDLNLTIPISLQGAAGPGGTPTSGWIVDPSGVSFDPAYVGGPINFTVQLWQGASYAAASQAGSGLGSGSTTWTEPGMLPGGSPVLFADEPLLGFNVALSPVVPEPTTLALAGLGAAGMLLFRKRQ
jgi:hypothetical protein